jgi:hypothetical protein
MVNAQKDNPLDKLKSRFLRKKPIFLLVCAATLLVGLSTLLTAIKNISITVKDTVEERKLYSNANKASALRLGMYASSIFSFKTFGKMDFKMYASIETAISDLDLDVVCPTELVLKDIKDLERLHEISRSFDKAIRSRLRKKKVLFYWYDYGYCLMGMAPLLTMIAMAPDPPDDRILRRNLEKRLGDMRKALLSRRGDILKDEKKIGLPSRFKQETAEIHKLLLSIGTNTPGSEIMEIVNRVGTHLQDVLEWLEE